MQPILRTVVTAATFGISVWIGRPLIARFARDFCPLTEDVRVRPAIVQLFRRLTYLWAGVNDAAAVSLTLLMTLSTAVFRRHGHRRGVGDHVHGVVLTVGSAGADRSSRRTRHGDRAERLVARLRDALRLTATGGAARSWLSP